MKENQRERRGPQPVLCADFFQHLRHVRLQLGKVNGRDFPKLLVVEPLVFVPQDVADPDNGTSRRIGVFGEVIRRQGFRGFRNDLHGAFHRAAMYVATLVLHERKAANDHSDALDLVANMKQTGAGLLLTAIKKSAPPPVRHPR
jgi:hypothetical protein